MYLKDYMCYIVFFKIREFYAQMLW